MDTSIAQSRFEGKIQFPLDIKKSLLRALSAARMKTRNFCRPWHQFFLLACWAASSFALNCTSDPCMYGICLDNQNSSYSCYCIDGYTGINCEINYDDCWSDPCQNGGTCTDAVASYNCSCPDGFIGVDCEQKYSECLNQPCLNNGTCIDYNGFSCQCPEGYSGDYCEVDISVCNSTICRNGGECIDGPGYVFSCHCREGWTGELCEDDIDECLSTPCQNGGLCLNIPATYTCACLFGFTGKDCDKPVVACDNNPCENDAMCLLEDSQLVCYCVPDYHGARCEQRYNDCESKFARCENGGTCIDGINDYTCACPAPYTGEKCLDALPTPQALSTASTTLFTWILTSTSCPDCPPTRLSTQTTEESTSRTQTTTAAMIPSSGTSTDILNVTSRPIIGPEFTTVRDFLSSLDGRTATTPEPTTTSVFQLPETTRGLLTTTESSQNSTGIRPTSEAPTNVTAMFGSSTMTVGSTSGTVATPVAGEKTSQTILSFNITSTTWSPSSLAPATSQRTSKTSTASSVTDRTNFTVSSVTPDPGPTRKNESLTTLPTCLTEGPKCNCTSPNDCRPQGASFMNAAFSGKSYVHQQVRIDDNGQLKVFLRLKTKAKSGIIVHAFMDEERYILLYMELGQMKFQFSCGLQTMLLGEIDTPINNGYDIDVEMRFRYAEENRVGKCSAQLLVNDSMAMSGEQTLFAREDIDKNVRLHLGGIPHIFSHYFPRIALGFVGCMSMLKVNDVERHFVRDSVETFQIEECVSFLCLVNPCRNFGSCHDINGKVFCKCVAGYTGEVCEKTACDDNPCYSGATCISSPGTGFLCVCPLGMHGLRCEEENIVVQPSFSVFIPGFSSYAAYGITSPIKDNMELKLRILPHTTDQISLLAFTGQAGTDRKPSDYFSLTYVKGYIMLTWDLGSGVRRIFTKHPLSNRASKSHGIVAGRRGRDAWLAVDGVGNVTGQAVGTMTQLDVSPVLYIGGHKSRNFEALPHDLPLHTGFSGCIFDVELRTDQNVLSVTKSSPATGRGVGECHRNECTHNICQNGAVCLNHGPTYSCICMKEWEGSDCSVAVACPPDRPACLKTV